MFLLSATLSTLLLYCLASAADTPPHIIFILADDLGWNDVSYHGSPQIPTPNIDALAASGIVLHNYYACPQCTPSRGSLMTGKYPIHIGLQHFVIGGNEPVGLPLNNTLMPQHLKKLGYATHMIGKWHLGYFKSEYTPTFRGFDTFFGYLNGRLDYYDYTFLETTDNPDAKVIWGYDLYDGTKLVKNFRGKYSTDVYTEKALAIISDHNISEPLFMYFSPTATHAGNSYDPLQAPPADVAKHKYIKTVQRRMFAGVLSKLDESVGKIFQSLSDKDMLKNTIIVFCSDNGGEAEGVGGGYASNYPLRSMKMHLFEGGVRVPALIWSPLLNLKEPRTSKQMMHISDWLPTLYSAAGGNVTELGGIDGINMWSDIIANSPSPRTEILLNIDSIYNMAALRRYDYKLVSGAYPDNNNLWYGPTGREDIGTPKSMDEWVWKNGSVVKEILEESGNWLVKTPDLWRANLTQTCNNQHKPHGNRTCDCKKTPCLYNIIRDPCEYQNLASRHPKIVRQMMELIRNYNQTAMAPLTKPSDARGDPRCHDFAYVPWLDEENLSDCPYLN